MEIEKEKRSGRKKAETTYYPFDQLNMVKPPYKLLYINSGNERRICYLASGCEGNLDITYW